MNSGATRKPNPVNFAEEVAPDISIFYIQFKILPFHPSRPL